jgi:phosphoribosylamine--glycine ligase
MAKGRRVLVVGAGGREHALARRLLDSPSVAEVMVSPGNAGTARLARNATAGKTSCNVTGPPVEVARASHVDLVVVGPEAPLCAGVVDELAACGIAAYGPSRGAARLEGSKAFMKNFLERHGILTARFHCVAHPDDAERAVHDFPEPPVVKADGLCAGKGVTVTESHEAAVRVARGMLSGESFGNAGKTVVIEERVAGDEASIHAICDGERYFMLPASQDHKRIGDGDTGPNTGGMGAYAPAPLVTPELGRRIQHEVIERTLRGMRQEGVAYRGTLYAGLMITPAGDPYVLEFNVRFGDPETQVLLDVIDGDLADALDAAARGQLLPDVLGSSERHALCVVLAAEGYPGSPRQGDCIECLEAAEALPDVRVYHAGTRLKGERLVTAGGRVLGVTGLGSSLRDAHARAYQAADLIRFSGKQYRSDIGRRALGPHG